MGHLGKTPSSQKPPKTWLGKATALLKHCLEQKDMLTADLWSFFQLTFCFVLFQFSCIHFTVWYDLPTFTITIKKLFSRFYSFNFLHKNLFFFSPYDFKVDTGSRALLWSGLMVACRRSVLSVCVLTSCGLRRNFRVCPSEQIISSADKITIFHYLN